VRILFSHPMSLHLFALHCIEGQVCRDAKTACHDASQDATVTPAALAFMAR
jgi:hypothetical protein